MKKNERQLLQGPVQLRVGCTLAETVSHGGVLPVGAPQLTKRLGLVGYLAAPSCPSCLWIEMEMKLADDLGKPMLGVKPWGNARVPSEVRDPVDEMVGWQSHSVVGSVRELAE